MDVRCGGSTRRARDRARFATARGQLMTKAHDPKRGQEHPMTASRISGIECSAGQTDNSAPFENSRACSTINYRNGVARSSPRRAWGSMSGSERLLNRRPIEGISRRLSGIIRWWWYAQWILRWPVQELACAARVEPSPRWSRGAKWES